MNPRVSERSKALVSVCLDKKPEMNIKETENSDNEIIEGTPQGSPVPLEKVTHGTRKSHASLLLSEMSKGKSQMLHRPSNHHSAALPVARILTYKSPEPEYLAHEEPLTKNVEPFCSSSLLTPSQNPGNKTQSDLPKSTHCSKVTSYDAPTVAASPFSPNPHIMPKVHTAPDSFALISPFSYPNHLSRKTTAESSVEAPPFSPLTPRSNNFTRQCAVPDSDISPLPCPASPLQHMSPETTTLFNIFADSVDIESDNDESNLNFVDNYRPEFDDDDDSIQDPDYVNEEGNSNSSDDSSEKSISVLTTSAEINQPTTSSTEILSCNVINPETTPKTHCMTDDDDITMCEADPESNKEPILPIEDNASVELAEAEEPSEHVSMSESPGRPKKGRKRLYGGQTREERKKRKYSNLPYVNWKKNEVPPKNFIDFNCNCKKNCPGNISVDKRMVEFNKFYDLGTYNAQNMYLAASVKEQPVKREYVSKNNGNISKKKTYSREYSLQGIQVCKLMFIKTIQTTSKRINTALLKMRSENCITDKRGRSSAINKVPSDSELLFINVVKRLPTYVSHYRRANNNNTKYLRPEMTFQKIYDIYCDESKAAQKQVISLAKARQIFTKKFNLRTKPLHKDTCNKCDFFQSQLSHAKSEEDRISVKHRHDSHIEKANSLRNRLKIDMKLAKDDPFTETLTFDLQKTLPLPRIPTNLVFYKRQMWVYNLGIHSGSDEQVHCNVWIEGEAGRGAQEVGSCLIKHVKERLKENVTNLITWSDSCGGQNRNIKLTLMFKALLNDHPTLQTISIRFLESGHSFLPNDTDFGKIECALKHQQRIYTPEDYIQIMISCKKQKPMMVHRMQKEDFLSSSKLEKSITNRKKAVDGSKVSWLNTKEIMLKKDSKDSLFMRASIDEEFQEVNIKKGVRNISSALTVDLMEPLWPTGKAISEAKLNDLKSLMHLIPKDAHSFYKNLTGDVQTEDDIDGFSGEPDFDIELNNMSQ